MISKTGHMEANPRSHKVQLLRVSGLGFVLVALGLVNAQVVVLGGGVGVVLI